MRTVVHRILSENAVYRFSRWLPCCIGIFLLLHAGNAVSGDIRWDWQEKSGPISIVNQSPVQLLFLQPAPDRADTLPKGRTSIRLNTTVTNTLLSEKSTRYSGGIDTEMIRTSLELSHGVLPGLELGLSFSVNHFYSGFMDKPILEVERMSGKIRGIRREEDPGRVTYFLMRGDEVIISASENRTGVGDLVLRAKKMVWDEEGALPRLSARLAVKLPTGDEDRAFGSGEVDCGLGLLFQKDIERMSFYLNGDVIFPGDAFDAFGVSLREFYGLMLGAEHRCTPRLSVVAQMSWSTRPFKDTGLEMLDRRIYELLIGVTYRTKNGVFIQGGGMEDIVSSFDAGADFTLFLNAGMNF